MRYVTMGGRRWRMTRVGAPVPRLWVPLPPPKGGVWGAKVRDWPYVLQAIRVPYVMIRGGSPSLWVPALLAGHAAEHLGDYDAERPAPRRAPDPPRHPLPWLAPCVLLFLMFLLYALRNWDLLRDLSLSLGFPPTPRAWLDRFAYDDVRIRLFHEWSRCATALFLHQDLGHLVANAAYTLVFARMLAARTGSGLAVLLVLWAAALGNALTVPLRDAPTISSGFSTATFAVIGVLSGFMSRWSKPSCLLPLAAGAALLAMLGTEGETTDYAAHVCGLVAGMAAGLGAGQLALTRPALFRPGLQAVYLALGLALPALAFLSRMT